jgi:nitrogen regulatory protein P-II 1
MKKIEAIIRPEKVNSVIRALEGAGYHGVTVFEVAGHGRQRGHAVWSGEEQEVQLRPKVMLVIVIKTDDLEKIMKAIMDTAKTDRVGDGKIFVTDLNDVARIRTGERGEKAIG